MSDFFKKVVQLQNELKVPKVRTNDYGKFKFRNAEDILTAVNPLLKKYELFLTTDFDVKVIDSRFYMQCTATIFDLNDMSMSHSSVALCREPNSLPKMDECQASGASMSYSKKYALCNLFNIDDGIDSDSTIGGKESAEDIAIRNLDNASSAKELKEVWYALDKLQGKPRVSEKMKDRCRYFHNLENQTNMKK